MTSQQQHQQRQGRALCSVSQVSGSVPTPASTAGTPASGINRIGSSCISLIIRFTVPHGERAQAARVSLVWYAAACHPTTWRNSAQFRLDPPDVTVNGIQMSLGRRSTIQTVASSKVYRSIEMITCEQWIEQADYAALQQLGCLRGIKLECWGGCAYRSLSRANPLNSQSLNRLQYLSMSSCPPLLDGIMLPQTLEYLEFSRDFDSEYIEGLAEKVLPLLLGGNLRSIYLHSDICPVAVLLSYELQRLGLPLDHPLTLFPGVPAENLRDKSPSRPRRTTYTPAYWIRIVMVHEQWFHEDIWPVVQRRFPDVDQLVMDDTGFIHCTEAYKGTLPPLRAPRLGVWAKEADQISKVHTLRMRSEPCPKRTALRQSARDWFRCSGMIFSGLHTLELPAHGPQTLGWKIEFQRMPLLTDVTMTDLLLTDSVCADFSHLPRLRHLRRVLWPLSNGIVEDAAVADRRAAHFPSLTFLDLRSSADTLDATQILRESQQLSSSILFPRRDFLHFVLSLPRWRNGQLERQSLSVGLMEKWRGKPYLRTLGALELCIEGHEQEGRQLRSKKAARNSNLCATSAK